MSVIVCPSGMSLEIRGLKGKEIKALTDRAALKNGTFFDKILAACTANVVNPGPYDLIDGSLNWDDVLIGDKTFTLVQIRIATFGSQFTFRAACGGCKKRPEYEVDLNDLPIKNLSADDLKAFRGGNRLKTKIQSTGAEVVFRLGVGIDERRAAQNKDKEKSTPLQALQSQIVSIDGVTDVAAFLDELNLGAVMSLLKELQKRDCGVDTTAELECVECGAEAAIELPLGRAFWLTL